jgi:DNA-binding transcriptional LysR family regulator
VTLKQLEAFYWAARLGSFAVAALRLHVTQSSLSRRISDLEEDLNQQLFSRSGQRATITDEGARLLPYASQMLELEAQARSGPGRELTLRGVCRFGVSELVATTWLPKLVTSVLRHHPDLVLQPHVDLTVGLERKLERGEIDFAIIPGPSRIPTLAHRRLGELEYAWMAAPARLAPGTVLTPHHFVEHPVITLTTQSTLTQSFDRWAEQQALEIPRRLVCNSLLALVGLTTAGVGISFFPKPLLRPLLQRGQLVELVCEPVLPRLSYCFHWRGDDTRRLIAVLQEAVASEADFLTPSVMEAPV